MAEIPTDPDMIHVFAVDLTMPEATALAEDGAALSHALGDVDVEPGRAAALDTRALGDLGLANYLNEGEGVASESLKADATKLSAVKGPIIILRPRAVSKPLRPREPLRHLGSYRLDRGTPPGMPLRAASAEGSASGVPPTAPSQGAQDRRASGTIAVAATVVALLVAFLVWWVAT